MNGGIFPTATCAGAGQSGDVSTASGRLIFSLGPQGGSERFSLASTATVSGRNRLEIDSNGGAVGPVEPTSRRRLDGAG